MAKIVNLNNKDGITIYPKTLTDAVYADGNRTMSEVLTEVAYVTDKESVTPVIEKTNADTLNGKSADYYATATDITLVNNEIVDLKKADQSLSDRIDLVAPSEDGESTGLSELVDIRLKADGTTADTAGNAVREQITELNEKMELVDGVQSAIATFENVTIDGVTYRDCDVRIKNISITDGNRVAIIGNIVSSTNGDIWDKYVVTNRLFVQKGVDGTWSEWESLTLNSDLANYLPLWGGVMTGDITIARDGYPGVIAESTNGNAKISMTACADGSMGVHNATKDKWIINSDVDGNVYVDGVNLNESLDKLNGLETFWKEYTSITIDGLTYENATAVIESVVLSSTNRDIEMGIVVSTNNGGIWNKYLASKKPIIRRKIDGTWSDWESIVLNSDLANYLPLSGGTMTGSMAFNSPYQGNYFYLTNGDSVRLVPTDNLGNFSMIYVNSAGEYVSTLMRGTPSSDQKSITTELLGSATYADKADRANSAGVYLGDDTKKYDQLRIRACSGSSPYNDFMFVQQSSDGKYVEVGINGKGTCGVNKAKTADSATTLTGLTATVDELNFVDGVTSNIQTQLNAKATSNHTHKYAGSSSAGGAATTALACTGNSATATKATQDANGNNIVDTYATKSDMVNRVAFTGAGKSVSTLDAFVKLIMDCTGSSNSRAAMVFCKITTDIGIGITGWVRGWATWQNFYNAQYSIGLEIIFNTIDGEQRYVHIEGTTTFTVSKACKLSDLHEHSKYAPLTSLEGTNTRVANIESTLKTLGNNVSANATKISTLQTNLGAGRLKFTWNKTALQMFIDNTSIGNVALTKDVLSLSGGTVNGLVKINNNIQASNFKGLDNKDAYVVAGASSNYVRLCGNQIHCTNTGVSANVPIYASAFTNPSSRLIKENIQSLTEEEARKILSLEAVSFDYKEKFGGDKNQRGLIAEDVLEIIPYCVNVPEGYDENDFDEEKGIMNSVISIDYSKLSPYLIKMQQIHDKEINALKEENASLKESIATIMAELEALKAKIQ